MAAVVRTAADIISSVAASGFTAFERHQAKLLSERAGPSLSQSWIFTGKIDDFHVRYIGLI